MTRRRVSEATDERGVTHHVRGGVRFVRLPKGRRRKNPDKQGHYVTRDDCRWWCTGRPIPVNSPAAPGRTVDCMSCLVSPPENDRPIDYRGTVTGRMSSKADRIMAVSTPRERDTKVFDVSTRTTRSISTGRRVGRRR